MKISLVAFNICKCEHIESTVRWCVCVCVCLPHHQIGGKSRMIMMYNDEPFWHKERSSTNHWNHLYGSSYTHTYDNEESIVSLKDESSVVLNSADT